MFRRSGATTVWRVSALVVGAAALILGALALASRSIPIVLAVVVLACAAAMVAGSILGLQKGKNPSRRGIRSRTLSDRASVDRG